MSVGQASWESLAKTPKEWREQRCGINSRRPVEDSEHQLENLACQKLGSRQGCARTAFRPVLCATAGSKLPASRALAQRQVTSWNGQRDSTPRLLNNLLMNFIGSVFF